MRICVVSLAAALAAGVAVPAEAADRQSRWSKADRAERSAPARGRVVIERIPRTRGIVVEQFAGERLRVIDSDGTELTRSFPDPAPPVRIEKRVYVREGEGRPFFLYGGFFGPDRWGYSREGW